jgi:release factor glutamine methyltransferase
MSAAPGGNSAASESAPVTIAGALAAARLRIGPLEARVLMEHVLGRDAAHVISHAHDALSELLVRDYALLVDRRVRGEPVAYLTGSREFFSREYRVDPGVLIPRPETELLVEAALERFPAHAPCRVLDLGTGSGCIAITIALERPRAAVTAVDASPRALAVARGNAERLGALHVRFLDSDWYAALDGERFEVIVANPPYIAAGDAHLGQGDLRYEPVAALSAGADGLACIRTIIDGAGPHLSPGGWLLLEHGHDQAAPCAALLRAAGLEAAGSRPDLAGIARVACARRAGI